MVGDCRIENIPPHHFQELLVAWIHEEAQECQGYLEARREVSLVGVELSLAQTN
jgi:hypothetical protein